MSQPIDVVRTRMSAAMSAAMSAVDPGRPAADALCESCVGLLGVDGAAVSIVLGGVSSGTYGASGDTSRRVEEYQFTYGEGPGLDAVSSRAMVLAPDLDSPGERRWPAFTGAVLEEGIRGVFAVPIVVSPSYVGALDLFRERPGPLIGESLFGAIFAAELAVLPLLDLVRSQQTRDAHADLDTAGEGEADGDPGQGRDREGGDDRESDARRVSQEQGDDGPWDGIDRVEVYQATGMVMEALDVDAAEALLRLRAHAISTNQTASQVARAVIERRLVLERDGARGVQ